jgi:hypothetical protein
LSQKRFPRLESLVPTGTKESLIDFLESIMDVRFQINQVGSQMTAMHRENKKFSRRSKIADIQGLQDG